MQTFDFPYHLVEDTYPSSSTVIQFGGGYQFATKPRGPDQIGFKLSFKAMWFFERSPGVVDHDREPQRNMQCMQNFYEAHRLYEPFYYPHPRRGLVKVRFAKPLQVPKGVEKGDGATEQVNIEFILQP
ncbi:hypothetical protein [Mesorhizobium sp. M7A.F.Ca.MR.362.00.0.0]|uniref:hypothetical protein n=1 Tax=Mesorhizobium sp. M7A.F.Ca.MR.362.00.0.0 TaxID=2496779 RepID=UPI000FD3AB05|nr:hypothetical protein [Mesorhizobium sp. M7A.F.Ca.MR.362.00.0.0]RUU74357.1 hypothetical protein EOC06_33865 [Mesorhizobium sp. M7A.F.Ca.MR.362.00.0.0]RWN95452.1 MAG: hypothetical protein EOS05_11705 [Mesorhizobium sp.]